MNLLFRETDSYCALTKSTIKLADPSLRFLRHPDKRKLSSNCIPLLLIKIFRTIKSLKS